MRQDAGIIGTGRRQRHRHLRVEELFVFQAGEQQHRRHHPVLKFPRGILHILVRHHAQRGMVREENRQSEERRRREVTETQNT